MELSLAIANAVGNILIIVLLVIMVRDSSLFNQGLFSEIANLTETSLARIEGIWLSSIRISLITIVLISAWDSINAFIKLKK